jgi:hypothetical protein
MSVVTTGTLTVNAAFLQEIKEVHLELWDLLAECRTICARPIFGWRQCSGLLHLFRETRDKLALHFALEEAYGYFEDPIEVAPRLADRCAVLREEHGSLYLEMVALVEEAEQLMYERRLTDFAGFLPAAFEAFDQRLQAHEAAEMDLIQEAFAADLGVGD